MSGLTLSAVMRAVPLTLLAWFIGSFAVDLFSERLGDSLSNSWLTWITVGYLLLFCGYLTRRSWCTIEDKKASRSPAPHRKHPHKVLIIALSMTTIFLICSVARDYREYRQRFVYATSSTTGTVLESDPGSRDPEGDPPASHYQFRVRGVIYDGWISDKLPRREQLSIRYNPSDPRFNHAEDDKTDFLRKEGSIFVLLFLLGIFLVQSIRDTGERKTSDLFDLDS